MCFANAKYDYPEVFNLFKMMKYCKDNYLLAMSAKELFIAEAKYGIECPLLSYEEYYKRYVSLFNYANEDMYGLLIESLVRGNFEMPTKIKKELEPSLKLEHALVSSDYAELDEALKIYTPSTYEKLLIATAKKDYAAGEKAYKKLQLHKLSALEAIIANYCNFINRADDEALAAYIINVAGPHALRENNGRLYKMFLIKLSNIAFNVGKYKSVAEMNLIYFEMLDKCKKCML
jgi:hypothetical protein